MMVAAENGRDRKKVEEQNANNNKRTQTIQVNTIRIDE